HREKFPEEITLLHDRGKANGEYSDREEDIDILQGDEVGEAATEYGILGAKIESLAQLRRMPGIRAELAMLSLARAYVSNCVVNNGKWTSGLHLLWWTRSRLAQEPQIKVSDIRTTNGLPLERQAMLAAWSLLMLRLTFIEDVARYAEKEGDSLALLTGISDRAAEEVNSFNIRRLLHWMKRAALTEMDRVLPKQRYIGLAKKLTE
ncbi:MAG: hypothetical protein GY862_07685, partial [Gammaproteobacteria bacterium]|nr:hypothetical protein [Gammaproteobacteria bacterium]